VQLRSARIELFASMCHRAGVAVPHTLGELLACLIALGLFHLELTTTTRSGSTPGCGSTRSTCCR
jgi:hypothetical protein